MVRHRNGPSRALPDQDAATQPAAPARGPATAITRRTPPRIGFVHIPKTAGRSVFHALEQALGAANCTSFSPRLDQASFTGKRFLAGHVYLSEATRDAFIFTFLREPVQQLASHLRWLDRYNLPIYHEETLPLSDSIMEAVRRVGETDFGSARSLQAFFDWLPQWSHARLANVQCEVLAAAMDRVTYHDETEMAAVAIANLDRLDFVGLAERIDRDLPALFRRLHLRGAPVVTHQNTQSSNRRIDLGDAAIRQVLERYVAADIVLYRHATGLRARKTGWRGITARLAARWQS